MTLQGSIILAIGTKNPAKVVGIEKAFGRYYAKIELHTVDSSSVAKAQPRGLEEMTDGATARAKFALSKAGVTQG